MGRSASPEQAGFFWTEQLPIEIPPTCAKHGKHPDGLIACPGCATEKSHAAKEHVEAIESHEDAVKGAIQGLRGAGDDPLLWTSGSLNKQGTYRLHLTPSKSATWSFCDSEVIPGRTQSRHLKQVMDKSAYSLYCTDCLERAGYVKQIDRGR